mgnify:CR=1 FL=1
MKPLTDLAQIIVSEKDIQHRVSQLADQIGNDYQKTKELLLVSILRGAFIFTADLARQLRIPHSVDFIALTSYKKSTSSGEVRMISDLRESAKDKHVLIIEDIVDSGTTLNYLARLFKDRGPASVRTCVMVAKERRHRPDIDYLGFNIPDVWVVGYGLDYDDRYRTLPYIAELKAEVYS